MQIELWTRTDLRNLMDGLAQTAERFPPSIELFRMGYLCALYDLSRQIGSPREEPQLRRPVNDLREVSAPR